MPTLVLAYLWAIIDLDGLPGPYIYGPYGFIFKDENSSFFLCCRYCIGRLDMYRDLMYVLYTAREPNLYGIF